MTRSAKMTWVARMKYVLGTQGMKVVTDQNSSHL
jgi:hypothetical protein